MVRSQVMELRGEVTGAIIEAVKRSKGGLTSDEVRAAIHDRVPAATVRGIMSKLEKRGKLTRTDDWREGRSGVRGQVYVVPADDADEPPPAQKTLEQLRSDYLAAIGTLEHRAQRDEMRGLYRNFILSLPLDQQVEDLRGLVKNEMAHGRSAIQQDDGNHDAPVSALKTVRRTMTKFNCQTLPNELRSKQNAKWTPHGAIAELVDNSFGPMRGSATR